MKTQQVPSAQKFNVKPIYSKKKVVRDGADDCERVREIMRRSQLERTKLAIKCADGKRLTYKQSIAV